MPRLIPRKNGRRQDTEDLNAYKVVVLRENVFVSDEGQLDPDRCGAVLLHATPVIVEIDYLFRHRSSKI